MIETIYSDPNFLEHHGVKGMKWGVRKDEKALTAKRNLNNDYESRGYSKKDLDFYRKRDSAINKKMDAIFNDYADKYQELNASISDHSSKEYAKEAYKLDKAYDAQKNKILNDEIPDIMNKGRAYLGELAIWDKELREIENNNLDKIEYYYKW